MMPTPSPRLHVLMRPGCPTALVIRQGPSRTFCTLAWNLGRDSFEVGQWVKHKLYPERGDISPDGKWHLYFALDGQWDSETKGSWTGLAKVPYLKCVKMWPQGDTWGGGGLLYRTGDVPDAYRHIPPGAPLPPQFRQVPGTIKDRLLRDGWTRTRNGFEKPVGDWTLRKYLPSMGFTETHELISPSGTVHDCCAWEWADLDMLRERIVYAEDGRIWTVDVVDPIGGPRLLYDAHGMTFEAIAAPY
jgi:hypothetical protein